MSTTYPAREPFFAHRFVRVLTKSAAVQELGTEAAWLLTVVAHQEDAKRYSGPVTYWNEQLMPLCGFASKGRLVRARERAVAAGWLHYEPGAKGQPGRYWCQIPESQQSLTDGPCDESLPDSVPLSNGKRTANGRNADGKRTANGPHSTLTLIPVPEEGAADAADASLESDILDRWNAAGLIGCRLLTPARRKALRARAKSPDWLRDWPAAIEKASRSEFCCGGNDRRWRADIDWFLRPDTVTKIMEGKYDDRASVSQSASNSDDIMARHTAEALARNRAKLEAQRVTRTAGEGAAS